MPEPAASPRILLTCEHAGRRVPSAARDLFTGTRARRALASHRGWDPGALDVARRLAAILGAPLVHTPITRLLVDANRSPHNPAVFSTWTRRLSVPDRKALLARFHEPHWERVRVALAERLESASSVLHVAVHSFTPILGGQRRDFEVGLLYDPARSSEKRLALRWQGALRAERPGLRVRRNAPYRGNADGLTTALRREHTARRYLGFELELSQRAVATPASRRGLARTVAISLLRGIADG